MYNKKTFFSCEIMTLLTVNIHGIFQLWTLLTVQGVLISFGNLLDIFGSLIGIWKLLYLFVELWCSKLWHNCDTFDSLSGTCEEHSDTFEIMPSTY